MRFVRATTFSWPLLAALLLGGSASAAPIGSLDITLQTQSSQGTTNWSGVGVGTQVAENQYDVQDGTVDRPAWDITWQDVSIDIDPGVNGVFSVTNNLAVVQTFTLIVDAPVLPVLPSSLMFGSSSITVADANFSGSATLSTVNAPPTAMYNGRIDLVAVTPSTNLYSSPFTLSVATGGGTNSATQSFGVFPGSVPGPAVAGFLGIQHVFTLTPGDTATFNSTFHVIVPEPGALALLGLGLAVLIVRRSA